MTARLERVLALLVRVRAWLLDFLADPDGSSSMARLCAFGFAVAGIVVAILHPEHALTVTALVGGGAVAILNRTKNGGAALLLAAGLALPGTLHAQQTADLRYVRIAPRDARRGLVAFDEQLRDSLARRYRATQAAGANAYEDGYCLRAATMRMSDTTVLVLAHTVVEARITARVISSDRVGITMSCPLGTILTHTHSGAHAERMAPEDTKRVPDWWHYPSSNDVAHVPPGPVALVQYGDTSFTPYRHPFRYVWADSVGWARARQRRRTEIVVTSGVALGYVTGLLEHDPGGYHDSYRPLADKQAHFASSAVVGTLTSAALGDRWGFAACLATGAALELGQRSGGGYFSTPDLAYDAAGCAAGILVRRAAAWAGRGR